MAELRKCMDDNLTLKQLIEEKASEMHISGSDMEVIEYILSVGAGIGAKWALSKVELDVPNIEEMVRNAMMEVFEYEGGIGIRKE